MDKMIYRKEPGKAQMVMEAPQDYVGGYQFSMLSYNEPEGYLPVSECSEGMTRRLYYDVTGCSCLADMMIRGKMDAPMIEQLIRSLLLALTQAGEYLLDGGRICLDPAYIYYKKDRFFFCFIPFKESDFDWEFRHLADFISDHVQEGDERAAKMVAGIADMAESLDVNLQNLQEIVDLSREEKKENEQEALLPPVEEMPEEEDLSEDMPGLPWDQWHLESKPGLFRWP